MTSKERVLRTLDFSHEGRVPQELWALPWAHIHHAEALRRITEDFTWDFTGVPGPCAEYPRTYGDPHEVGEYTDAWGCTFTNIQRGVIGEVKHPISTDEGWNDIDNVHIPVECLTLDVAQVNAACKGQDKFIFGGACPRIFEQLQFIRGSEQFYIDLLQRPPQMMAFIERMHQFHCDQLSVWAKTDVDALNMMDDWGAQRALLISPAMWRELFKPLYKDYIDIAHRAGKKMFMHSDGYTLDILPDLIELGLDALNTQIFCIGLDKLLPYAGRITFWGELDRQHLLPYGTVEEVRKAARDMKTALYRQGGVIAQLEFSAGARPENVRAFYEEWEAGGR